MKQTFVLSIFILYFSATNSFAQMGHGMMREMPGGMMHEQMMSHMGMMSHEQMMGSMKDMMNDLSKMMDGMSRVMKGLPEENFHQMSSLMKDICSEINRLSEMMDTGATEDDIRAVKNRITDMQGRMTEMGE